ncbi:MAG TPA: RnfABCDGE type electron transport complex subunit D, partial [Patescibacteria group bacterium]|nr:RnfABCDGE type electron transport complex subunit D [Patescibacteria group bacterium]
MWLKILKPIDRYIDSITMYRLLLYYLLSLIAIAVFYCLIGNLNYHAINIAVSTSVITLTCWLANKFFSRIFNAPTNPESSILTGLILALILPPNINAKGIAFFIMASILAMASKYIFTYKRSHIFNPAAVAIVLTNLGANQSATWWIGTSTMLPFVLIGGVLVMRKIQREEMILTFFLFSILTTTLYSILGHTSIISNLHALILSSGTVFFGFVMFCEPYTSPSKRQLQILYAGLVAIIIPPLFHIFNYYSSPEVALVIGNIFSFLSDRKLKLFPTLTKKLNLTPNVIEFSFAPNDKLKYLPGQFLEWTLPHKKVDSRGARRFFSITSSPTEEDIKLAVKFYPKGSSFKKALQSIDDHTPVSVSKLGGDFILPSDKNKKLVFIAGGIGITPYRSMIKYLMDNNKQRDITLLYLANSQSDLAYKNLIDQARKSVGL